LDKVDKYIYGHPQLTTKRLIFSMVNADHDHWYGFCAVNPWKAIMEKLLLSNPEHLHADFKTKSWKITRQDIFSTILAKQCVQNLMMLM
jgi:hypothetical protein